MAYLHGTGFLSVAGISVMTKRDFYKSLFWLTVPERESPQWLGGVAAGCRNRRLRDYVFNHNQKTDRANRKWGQNRNPQSPPPGNLHLLKVP